MLGRINAFFTGNVCKRLTGCTIANGINAGYIGLPVYINYYLSFIGFNTQGFKAHIFNIGNNTNRTQKNICFQGYFAGCCFNFCLYTCTAGINTQYFAAGHDGHALFFKLLFQFFADVFIFNRNQPWHKLNHGNLCTQAVIKISKLTADGTASANDHALGLGW